MESIGQILQKERELRQLSLEELSQTTRIPLRTLQSLEADRHDELPGEVFVRGFIKSYARSLGIDSGPLLERFGRASRGESAPAPITAVTAPDRGRRFGIAFAVVILLLLFTLALSIVLTPRRQQAPIELSHLSPCPAALEAPTSSSSAPSITETRIVSSRS